MTLKRSELSVGQTYEEVLVDDLKRTQLVMYSGASGDYNPLHTDEVYTREAAGYPGVFAHGMLTMGMTGRPRHQLRGRSERQKVWCSIHQPGLARRYVNWNGDGRRHT